MPVTMARQKHSRSTRSRNRVRRSDTTVPIRPPHDHQSSDGNGGWQPDRPGEPKREQPNAITPI
jgi:hypothetical protein